MTICQGSFIISIVWRPAELMALRTHTIEKKGEKRNQIWEWEETPELLAAIEQLHKSSQTVKEVGDVPKNLHVGNKNFAPFKPRRKK